MKKALGLMSFFIFIFALFQIVTNFLKKTHDINYFVSDGKYSFMVNEKYDKENNLGYYFFEVKKGNEKYNFYIDDNFNKQRVILKHINYVEKEGASCINPVYIDKKYTSPITCFKNGKQVSFYSVLNINLDDFKKYNIDISKYKDDDKIKNNKNVYYYENNVDKDEYLYFFKYKYLDLFTKNHLESLKIFEEDSYHNLMGRLIGEYFVTAKYDSDGLYSYSGSSIVNKTIVSVLMPKKLSKDTRVLGVFNNKLYLLDPLNKIEVMVDFENRHSRIINNEDVGFYFNGLTLEKISIQKLIDEKITFKRSFNNILNQYEPVVSYADKQAYYFLAKDGSYYKVYKGNVQNPILLFKKNINNVIVNDGKIYFRENDIIYKYDGFNLKKLIKYEDLINNNYYVYGVFNMKDKGDLL